MNQWLNENGSPPQTPRAQQRFRRTDLGEELTFNGERREPAPRCEKDGTVLRDISGLHWCPTCARFVDEKVENWSTWPLWALFAGVLVAIGWITGKWLIG